MRSIEDEARLAPIQPLTRLAASSCTSCRRRTKIARVAGAKFASRAPRCGIARASDRVVTRIVSGFALPRTLQFRSTRASPRRSRHGVSRLALARLVNERKDGREASPAAPEPLPRGAPPRGVGQGELRRRRRAILRSAETHTRRPRDRLGAHRPPFPPSGASSRLASPTSLLHLSSPVNAEPSPPEIAHFRPTPRSPRAGS